MGPASADHFALRAYCYCPMGSVNVTDEKGWCDCEAPGQMSPPLVFMQLFLIALNEITFKLVLFALKKKKTGKECSAELHEGFPSPYEWVVQ